MVLASGKRIAAVGREDGKVLWDTELEAEIGAFYISLALQPAGGQVACCMEELKTVSVRDARTGAELRRLRQKLEDLISEHDNESSGDTP